MSLKEAVRRKGRGREFASVDNFTRESLAIPVEQGIHGEQVVDVLSRTVAKRGAAKSMRGDD